MVVEAASSEHTLSVSLGNGIGLSVPALRIVDWNQRLNEILKRKTFILSNQSQNIKIKENKTRIKISEFYKWYCDTPRTR